MQFAKGAYPIDEKLMFDLGKPQSQSFAREVNQGENRENTKRVEKQEATWANTSIIKILKSGSNSINKQLPDVGNISNHADKAYITAYLSVASMRQKLIRHEKPSSIKKQSQSRGLRLFFYIELLYLAACLAKQFMIQLYRIEGDKYAFRHG